MKITRSVFCVILLIAIKTSVQFWGESDHEGNGFIKWDIHINDSNHLSQRF